MTLEKALCLVVAVFASGCAANPYMKLPQMYHRPVEVEERASEYHDPFPDSLSGPNISGRPRSFGRPRTAPRKAANLRGVHLLPPTDRLPESRQSQPTRYSKAVATD